MPQPPRGGRHGQAVTPAAVTMTPSNRNNRKRTDETDAREGSDHGEPSLRPHRDPGVPEGLPETDMIPCPGITGDFASYHTDEEYMSQTAYGTRHIHRARMVGFMSAAVAKALDAAPDGHTPVSPGHDRVRFILPVLPGDTLELRYQATLQQTGQHTTPPRRASGQERRQDPGAARREPWAHPSGPGIGPHAPVPPRPSPAHGYRMTDNVPVRAWTGSESAATRAPSDGERHDPFPR
jgi:acyl dehydratase